MNSKTKISIRLLALAAFTLFLSPPLHARTWENNDGRKIEAELTGIEGENAVLIKDGRTVKIPISSLSSADQDFIKAWKPAAEEEDKKSARKKEDPVTKKGACLSIKAHPDWKDKLKTLNVGWFYMWKAEKPDDAPKGLEYAPMAFGKKDRTEQNVEYVKDAKRKEDFKFLLGFNEPDQSSQANMTVEDALALWPKLMEAELPLVSPACANVEGEWMEAFMEGVEKKGCRVDYIAIHYYGGADPAAFLNKLERVHKKYKRPLWITEFAVADWKANELSENRFSIDEIKKFMREVLPKLDRLDYVHRYAWFSASPTDARIGNSALFKEDGSLTELGEIYAKQ
jgi:hypothetical protein